MSTFVKRFERINDQMSRLVPFSLGRYSMELTISLCNNINGKLINLGLFLEFLMTKVTLKLNRPKS